MEVIIVLESIINWYFFFRKLNLIFKVFKNMVFKEDIFKWLFLSSSIIIVIMIFEVDIRNVLCGWMFFLEVFGFVWEVNGDFR